MASALELDVTAEGVETREQLVGSRALVCREHRASTLPGRCLRMPIAKLVAESHRWNVD